MVVMPPLAKWMGMDATLAGAWLGGTIDATGAVAAAGKAMGPQAEAAALLVKINSELAHRRGGVCRCHILGEQHPNAMQTPGARQSWNCGIACRSLLLDLFLRRLLRLSSRQPQQARHS